MAKYFHDNTLSIGNTPWSESIAWPKVSRPPILAKVEGRNPAYSVNAASGRA